jgi:hypothetical protein
MSVDIDFCSLNVTVSTIYNTLDASSMSLVNRNACQFCNRRIRFVFFFDNEAIIMRSLQEMIQYVTHHSNKVQHDSSSRYLI